MNNDLKCLNKTLEDHLLWLSSNGSKGKQADFKNQNLSRTNLYNINSGAQELHQFKLAYETNQDSNLPPATSYAL